MLCEKCKIREANVQIVEIVNGARTEHFLCAQCAGEMELNVHSPQGDMPLAKLLSSLLSQTLKSQQKEKCANVVCPTCGTTYEQFIDGSKLGCADCYKVFDLLIGENIKQLQGSDRHHGKRPRYISGEIPETVKEDIEESITGQTPDGELLDRILDMRKKLRESVAAEEYEQAAKYRDELKTLEAEAAEKAVGSVGTQTKSETEAPDTKPSGKRTSGRKPSDAKPSGRKPAEAKPSGKKPSGTKPSGTAKRKPAAKKKTGSESGVIPHED